VVSVKDAGACGHPVVVIPGVSVWRAVNVLPAIRAPVAYVVTPPDVHDPANAGSDPASA